MKVSVIIPAYNEEAYLGRALSSLKNQTVKPDEIIVVDNNSRDRTAEIAKKFGATVVTEKKQGITHARNKGFNSVKHGLIVRCDADVILPVDWIEKIKLDFENMKIDALSGPVVYYDSPLNSNSVLPSQLYFSLLKTLSGGSRYLVGMNMIITQEMWAKVKNRVILEDSMVHEDVDISLKINRAGGVIGYDESLVVKSSARRIIHRPWSFFIEYSIRLLKTFWYNRG